MWLIMKHRIAVTLASDEPLRQEPHTSKSKVCTQGLGEVVVERVHHASPGFRLPWRRSS
jgi:hypothetical protein